jgi:hypothetical protein
MIGLIDSLCTISLNYKKYRAIADLHTFQFTVAHALRFSVSTSRILATDLNAGTITSNHWQYHLLPTRHSTGTPLPILQFLYWTVLTCTQLSPWFTASIYDSRYIDAARKRLAENTCHVMATHCCEVNDRAYDARALHSNSPWADTKKTLPPYCCLTLVLERVYWVVA